MQDSLVKLQILPASVSYLFSWFPVILQFPEITCICTTLIKSRESQQWVSSDTMLSWFCPLGRLLKITQDIPWVMWSVLLSGLHGRVVVLYIRDGAVQYFCSTGSNCCLDDASSLPSGRYPPIQARGWVVSGSLEWLLFVEMLIELKNIEKNACSNSTSLLGPFLRCLLVYFGQVWHQGFLWCPVWLSP